MLRFGPMNPFSGPGLVCIAVGFSLHLIGGLLLLPILIRYRLHSSRDFADGVKQLSSPARRSDLRRAMIFGAIAALGFPCWGLGMLIGDGSRNQPCRQGCQEAGYASGRMRGSPHVAPGEAAQGAYACWCMNSEQDWAPEPLSLDAP